MLRRNFVKILLLSGATLLTPKELLTTEIIEASNLSEVVDPDIESYRSIATPLNWRHPVESFRDLPAGKDSDAILVRDLNRLTVFSGGSWNLMCDWLVQ